MDFDPPMSYTSLQDGVFDVLVEERKEMVGIFHQMKTYHNINDLIRQIQKEIDSIIYSHNDYYVTFENECLKISVDKTKEHYRYIKISGITESTKRKIKEGITTGVNENHREFVSNLFKRSAFGSPRGKNISSYQCVVS